MTTETTTGQIEEIRAICETLAQDPLIKTAVVDDWGRFGNFQIMVVPVNHDRKTTTRIRGAVLRAIRQTGATLRSLFGPDLIRSKRGRPARYSRSFWMVDLDYESYDPVTNSFSR